MFGPTSDRVQQGGNTGGFVYNNPNGSRFVQNADGSKFYDPGPNGVGRKWYESPDGVRTYIADTHTDNSPSRHVKMEEKEVKMFSSYGQHSSSLRKSKSTPSKSPNKVKDQYDSDDTVPLYPERDGLKPAKTKETAKKTGITTKPPAQTTSKASALNQNKSATAQSKPHVTPTKPPPTPRKTTPKTPKTLSASSTKSLAKATPKSAKSPAKGKSKEVHIHIHHPPPLPAMNVTRVIHHSAKGDKEIVYKSPVKGKISKGQKKVVHIHHHRGD